MFWAIKSAPENRHFLARVSGRIQVKQQPIDSSETSLQFGFWVRDDQMNGAAAKFTKCN